MLIPAEAITVIAHLAGRQLGWTAGTARLMREADLDLWPTLGRGRRGATVSARHLVNLLIAAAAPSAEPVKAARTVADFRGLRLRGRSLSLDTAEPRTLPMNQLADLAQIEGFGSFLDSLIEHLGADMAAPGGDMPFAKFLTEARFEVALQSQADMPPIATVLCGGAGLIQYTAAGAPPETKEQTGARVLWWYRAPQQRLRQTAEISCEVLIALAAALAHGRPDFAFLPPDALAAALACAGPLPTLA